MGCIVVNMERRWTDTCERHREVWIGAQQSRFASLLTTSGLVSLFVDGFGNFICTDHVLVHPRRAFPQILSVVVEHEHLGDENQRQ